MLDLLQQPRRRGSSPRLAFLVAALRRPSVIGGIGQSGRRLAGRLASVIPSQGDPVVVELGPGTGPVSTAVRGRLGRRGRYLGVEVDASMVRYLRSVMPEMELAHADAARLDEVLAARGLRTVQTVVSSLPWSLLRADRQEAILDRVVECLAPDGVFTTVAVANTLAQSSGRRFRALLEARFDEVLPTNIIWRNWPPALTYVCRRPIGETGSRVMRAAS